MTLQLRLFVKCPKSLGTDQFCFRVAVLGADCPTITKVRDSRDETVEAIYDIQSGSHKRNYIIQVYDRNLMY